MNESYNKLINTLQSLFEMDKADLDFGIYRIMNQKRDEISRFLENDLFAQVKKSFADFAESGKGEVQTELDQLTKTLTDAGMDPEQSPKVRELREKLASSVDVTAIENEVFSHLHTFFSRYYDKGDFISQRRYKKDTYAIPYEGEEVKLYWANHDQYYIKSSEHLRDYAFVVKDGEQEKTVRFKLLAGDTEKDNVKAESGKERRFVLDADHPLSVENDELHIHFHYKPAGKKKQAKLNAEAVEIIFAQKDFDDWQGLLKTPAPTEKNPNRTLLDKHLNDYTARNTFDYFIHKDLGGFLRRELDFYIKNEILHLDDIDDAAFEVTETHLRKIKVIRTIAHKLIRILAQLEDFQKKLWLKKKFVVETSYCMTLDRVPEDLYGEIVANTAQHEEWMKLGFTTEDTEITEEYLKENPFLVLDTKFFDESFKDKLLASIENLDEQCTGLLIHSENFQALSLIQNQYRQKIKSIYIDPPYNTGSDDNFSYKDSYKSSSWLSMFRDRLCKAYSLFNAEGLFVCHMDEHEHLSLEWIVRRIFGETGDLGKLVWDKRNPKGDAKGIAVQHEYIHFATSNPEHLKLSENAFVRNKENAEKILFKAEQLIRKAGGVDDNVRKEFKKWIDNQKFSGGEKAYCLIDDERNVYQSVSMAWPNKKKAPDEYFQALIHPVTGKPCPVPGRGWRNPPKTMKSLQDAGLILFGNDENTIPRRKYLLSENMTENVASLYYMGSSDDALFKDIGISFENPKPVKVAKYFLSITARPDNSIILDYFAGSGTTAHAVINLNREDGGKRKYILVEMGEYFDTVLKPRIQKVIYSKDWKDGKPKPDNDGNLNGISHCFKYLALESYEDTLNNLTLKDRTQQQNDLLEASPSLREDYMLGYWLDVETAESPSLLNIEQFENPFDYKINIATGSVGATKPTRVDLVETFNYLIGLTVKHIDTVRGFKVITGTNPKDESVLIIWRSLKEKDNAALEEFMEKQVYHPRDTEFEHIYINGDYTLEDPHSKVKMIEIEFKRLMFDTRDM